MTHLSPFIQKAALEKLFPTFSERQSMTYHPEYNGWDSLEDMPKYKNTNKNNEQKRKYVQQDQKVNAQLIQHIIGDKKPKYENQKVKPIVSQNQNINNINQKNKQNNPIPNNASNQNPKKNQQFYSKPIPYNHSANTKVSQTQYNLPNQPPTQQTQSVYPNDSKNINEPPIQKNPKLYTKPQNKPQAIPTTNQAIKAPKIHPNYNRQITADQMDQILSN